MTAGTAFRSFFVSRASQKRGRLSGGSPTWSYRSKRLLPQVMSPSTWRSKSKGQSSGEFENLPFDDLAGIPRAHMTGVRTFINGQGKTTHASRMMQNKLDTGDDEVWPLRKQGETRPGIRVEHHFSSKIERAPGAGGDGAPYSIPDGSSRKLLDARHPEQGEEYV
ncbi:hypothetical protein MMC30_006600 [Trapelia coarctata]|nr:hypothetical protein [Trapelia coarctata]